MKSHSTTESDRVLDFADHNKIDKFLRKLENKNIIRLGVELGLDQIALKNTSSDSLLGDMISSWLRKDFNVEKKSGPPTWRSLCNALDEIGCTGCANDIKGEYKFE